jgi:hypothetical protein
MEEKTKTNEKQTAGGKFPPGNTIGNRFKKGETGNPSGRPKRTRLTDALREQLAEQISGKSEKTVAEDIARALIKEARRGNVQAAREIADRTEGRPAQKVDVDLQINDWRAIAQRNGVTEEDVIEEARLLIEQSNSDSSGE